MKELDKSNLTDNWILRIDKPISRACGHCRSRVEISDFRPNDPDIDDEPTCEIIYSIRQRYNSSSNMFSALAKCPECGYAMVRWLSTCGIMQINSLVRSDNVVDYMKLGGGFANG